MRNIALRLDIYLMPINAGTLMGLPAGSAPAIPPLSQ
jgi:hypothetical protein